MRPAIEVHHLRKAYGDFVAVRSVSFTVEAGEVFCLLGPNGAGKTTTTEILEGYRTRSGGDVAVLGFDPGRGERAMRERIGIVLQECGVQENLTVAEVFEMYGRYYPKRLATNDLIKLVELDAKADDRVCALSGGQRRRLDVGLALVGDPDLIFLDEPTTGFDPAARRNSWATIRALSELGKSVLLTTHFMDEAQALAHRIAVIVGGEVVAEGTPDELGGRDAAATNIDALLPDGIASDMLPVLGDARVTLAGNRLHVVCREPVAVAHRLTGWALDASIELRNLTISQPTLEDVYLDLTRASVEHRSKENAR